MDRVSKRFGAVQALDAVSFSVAAGEIRALCGENGAGKSTLVKMLMGIVRPDGGTIQVDGVQRILRDPKHAQSLGIGLVAQELSLAPRLSIVDNIWLGSAEAPLFYRIPGLRARAASALDRLGAADLGLDTPVSSLTIGQRQIVEIARLLARKARVLILDEPTATLSDAEIARLLRILSVLREEGHAIIYVSHRLGEVFEVCDSITVLRNGTLVGTEPITALDRAGLIERMLGRSMGEMYPTRTSVHEAGRNVRVDGLVVPGRLAGVTFAARAGQITCIAGLIGSGASLVNRALAVSTSMMRACR
jgi:ribose transport system ATP-binding protein/rhamnose transport system ATP-binding protein